MATVLAIIQRVATEIGVKVPDAVFSSTVRTHVELRDLCNEMAERIARDHTWQVLTAEATHTGDGTATAFDLPTDFARMPKSQQIWASSTETPLTHVSDMNRWLAIDIRQTDYVVGAWTRYGGQVHIKPALANAATARYFYITNAYGKSTGGLVKDYFTADDDTFRLDDRLLRLGMIWQWKANKNLPYAEHMATYEEHKAKLISDDRGPRMITLGGGQRLKGDSIAYPQAIDP